MTSSRKLINKTNSPKRHQGTQANFNKQSSTSVDSYRNYLGNQDKHILPRSLTEMKGVQKKFLRKKLFMNKRNGTKNMYTSHD